MSKPTTCKDAIALWEKAHGAAAAEAREVELQFQWPPVEKMDAALSTLTACEYWTLLTLFSSHLMTTVLLSKARVSYLLRRLRQVSPP
ncbi:hypothetical protein JYU34_010956 [Plutella xylostella]|uniref:Uncharacterized protein n=1 Tax=Plutella xylostella TaxID=51655 RepID=A0ABQ7QFP5_PLUXY|nr:hypothetical protein JYU34_010956 [Plutella xylostella]